MTPGEGYSISDPAIPVVQPEPVKQSPGYSFEVPVVDDRDPLTPAQQERLAALEQQKKQLEAEATLAGSVAATGGSGVSAVDQPIAEVNAMGAASAAKESAAPQIEGAVVAGTAAPVDTTADAGGSVAAAAVAAVAATPATIELTDEELDTLTAPAGAVVVDASAGAVAVSPTPASEPLPSDTPAEDKPKRSTKGSK